MKTNWKVLIAGALLAGLSGTAAARDNVSFSIGFGIPAPVYYAPPPPVYYAPAPVYYPSAYYAPPPPVVYYGAGWRHGNGHRHGHPGHRNGHHRGHR